MPVRGVRGATTVAANEAEIILAATQRLLREMVGANGIASEDIAAAWFTATPDLDAAFPARAARAMGWQDVPLLDAVEMAVPDSLGRCIRALLLWNTARRQGEIVHIYQEEAVMLRPDLANHASQAQQEGIS
jgi:chorismate mutase